MNLEWVESYLAVVRTKSFRLAAAETGVAQPTVSQRLRKLEHALGAPLVMRLRSGCVSTVAGERFQPFAESLLRLKQRALASLCGTEVVIGASSNIGTYFLPASLRRFRESEPDVSCRLLIDRNPAVLEALEEGRVDVAFTEWWDGRHGFEAVAWKTEELLLVVPPQHPWARRRRIRPRELQGLQLLGGETATGTARVLQQCLGAIAGRLSISMQLGSTEAVKRAVQHGLGVSLLLAGTVAEEIRSGVLIGLRITGAQLEKRLQCVHRSGLPESHRVRGLIRFLCG